ncbi:MBOAT family protein [bacterium]|nr:MBOAT family protein [bacterium]
MFYGWWDWRFLGLIVFCGITAFAGAIGIAWVPRRKKLILTLVLLAHLLNLGVFKYLDFAILNLNALCSIVPGSQIQIEPWRLILPVGISFYTFQALSYVIDVYRGELKPAKNLLHFFAYLSMFPQLVAGPVVRASCLLPQLEQQITPNNKQLWDGFRLIVFGMFKKVVIADSLSPIIFQAFSSQPNDISGITWWIVMIFFAFQIYCDFSGYSDIARGLGKWMGYEFPVNFNHPYISTNFKEFWGRWHISLSTWFRDYVYIPLGGGSKGPLKAIVFMSITMVVSGLWHGAGWSYLLWGGLHAVYLCVERLTKWPKYLRRFPFGSLISMVFVFTLTLIAWVFFRVGSVKNLSSYEQMAMAFEIIRAMLFIPQWTLPRFSSIGITTWSLFLCLLVFLRHGGCFLAEKSKVFKKVIHNSEGYYQFFEPVVLSILIVSCVFLRGSGVVFIYFQF